MKGLIFTYALTYGGAAVSLVQPFVGFLIFVCFAILKPENLWSWSVPVGNYSRIVAVALLVGWFLNGPIDWRFGRARGLVVALIGFWIWTALGAAQAAYPSFAWERVEAFSKIFLPFLVGLTLIDSIGKVKALAWVILLSQGYLAFEFNLEYLAGHFSSVDYEFGSLDNNSMAIVMVACTGFAFVMAMESERWWQKAVAFAAALFMAHFVLFSHSRGGMLALLLTGLVAFFLIPKTPKHYLAFAVAAAVMLRLAGPQVLERFDTTFADTQVRDESAQSRLEFWQAAARAANDNAVFGLGPDQWRFRGPEYGSPLGRAIHSTWFQVAAEHGFPGLFFLGTFYVLCVCRLWPVARGRAVVSDPQVRYMARMVIASIIGFATAAQFVTLHGVDVPYFIALVGAAIIKVSLRPQAPKSAPVECFAYAGEECDAFQ